jgi:hypothetical protein
MQVPQNKLLGVGAAVLISGLSLGYWLPSPNPQSTASKVSQVEPIANSVRVQIAVPDQSVSASEIDTHLDIDWSACTDNYGSDECLTAITPLIAEVDVVGDLSWIDLIERFDGNLKVMFQVVEDPACIPPATGFDPIVELSQASDTDKTTDQARANCGAKAFGELGALIRRCNLINRNVPTEERVLADAAERGITDLAILYDLEQNVRYVQLEGQWLDKECVKLAAQSRSAPTLYNQLGLSDSRMEDANRWFAQIADDTTALFKSDTYIERAVLLGDYRLAKHYLEAAGLTSTLLRPSPLAGYEHEKHLFVPIKERDNTIDAVVDKLITHVPEVGFAAKASHLVQRYPSLLFTDPVYLESIRDENESPYRIIGRPKKFIPEDNWYQRALDIATYGIAADRMNGVPADLPSNPLQSDVFHSEFWDDSDKKMYLERFLDANDWEYASQKANELVAAAKQRQNNP